MIRAGGLATALGQCSDVGENCPGPDHSAEPVAKNEIGSWDRMSGKCDRIIRNKVDIICDYLKIAQILAQQLKQGSSIKRNSKV